MSVTAKAQASQPPLAVTVSEAAGLLRLSRSATYRLISKQSLPSIQLGGCRRVLMRDLTTYLDQLARKASP